MIYYWIQLAITFITSYYFSKKVSVNTTITSKRRVTFFDCEGFRYMSNTRYVSYMDFLRFELTFKSNLYRETIKKGIIPILASQKIIYKKPLKLWDKFTITLKNEGWDNKWVYHSHIFKKDDVIYAIGYTKVAFWKDKKVQNLIDIIHKSGLTENAKSPSQHIITIFNNDSYLLKT
ncbi:MAG: acyl-CoA thioesterase [Flavobacteriaceae bacterium]